jgi:uncharacterized protein YggE
VGALAATAVAALGTRAGAQEVTPPATPPPSLTVIGDGHVDAVPDLAHLRLGVQTTAESAQAAQQANAERMNALVASLRGMGIEERDLQTSGLSLGPVTNREQQITGYRAHNTLTVTVRNLGQIGALYDAAVAAGANVGGHIRFGFADDAALRRQALAAAIAEARAQAEAMAQAAGVTLRGVRSIGEDSVSMPIPRAPMPIAAPAVTIETPIEPGEQRVTARVRVVFDLS